MDSSILSDFEYFAPTKLVFGEGQLKSIYKYLNFSNRILVVTGKNGAEESGALQIVKDVLSDHDLLFYSKITSNPKTNEINEGAKLGNNFNAEAIIGIGGGSAIDAAKAIAACIPLNGEVESILQKKVQLPENILPIIAVPTTAGTGSEMSKGAIITDPDLKMKAGIRGDVLLPKLAIVDPTLTYSLSYNLTAETGFDVFSHAIETFISKKANEITDIFSEYIIKKVIFYLPKLLENLNDKDARKYLMLSSSLAGINLGNSSTCLPHRLQYPLGAHTNCGHAKGVASLYRAWIYQTVPYAPHRFASISDYFNNSKLSKKASIKEKANNSIKQIEQFMEKIGVIPRMRDFGISKDLCEQMAHEVEGNLKLDPGATTKAAIIDIYKKSW